MGWSQHGELFVRDSVVVWRDGDGGAVLIEMLKDMHSVIMMVVMIAEVVVMMSADVVIMIVMIMMNLCGHGGDDNEA